MGIFNIFGKRPPRVEVLAPVEYTVKIQYPAILEFLVTVSRMKVEDDQRTFFQFDRGEVTVNGDASSDYIAADLAAQCGAVLYPLQLCVGADGSITQIFNHPEIVKRWEEKEPRLLEYFAGPEATEYIHATARSIQDEAAILRAIQQDLFLACWCNLVMGGRRTAYQLIPFKEPVPYEHDIKFTVNKLTKMIDTITAEWKFEQDGSPRRTQLTAVCNPIKETVV
ncbi:hypothetical protein [Chitinophaga silvisoli]|uniref:Uncharacterized protein n=1 Tax=Chitinophaga silvisoli TaxID=2291814 RepID=A0A3E1NYY9_9BACT|nr:hypothetical protein [Chitinophaga silvisoli]RFM33132.1 hypothetical protein DXN04_19055 [Chitinophaga silvisoli]